MKEFFVFNSEKLCFGCLSFMGFFIIYGFMFIIYKDYSLQYNKKKLEYDLHKKDILSYIY